MENLFEQAQLRDRRGRYCTRDQYRADKAESQVNFLRYDRDKWFRAYIALSREISRLTRKINELQSILNER